MKALIFIALSFLFVGCSTLPKMGSTELMKHMTDAYSGIQSFEDTGTVNEVEIDSGVTNVTQVNFHVQFVRGRAFRLELHSDNPNGIGPYSLIYYWDGSRWTIFNSIELYYGRNPVNTNADEAMVGGSGAALSHDLIPFTPRLLCLDDHFCGFRGSDGGELAIDGVQQTKRAEATIERLGGRKVYRLTLTRDVAIYHDIEDYWIDPQTFTIFKQQSHYAKKREGHTDITTLKTLHSPKPNSLPHDAVIKFSPPRSQPDKVL